MNRLKSYVALMYVVSVASALFLAVPPHARAAGQDLHISFRTLPDPPRSGDNQVEVTVVDAGGLPISDASVSVRFYMPAMPTMSMPEMQSMVTATHVARGVYRGSGKLVMGGTWEVTVTVTRAGKKLGHKKLSVQAKG